MCRCLLHSTPESRFSSRGHRYDLIKIVHFHCVYFLFFHKAKIHTHSHWLTDWLTDWMKHSLGCWWICCFIWTHCQKYYHPTLSHAWQINPSSYFQILISSFHPLPVFQARYKQSLDPTVDEVKKLCTSLRRNAKEERVLFHYNGHGVPRPTVNGEIWVFNKVQHKKGSVCIHSNNRVAIETTEVLLCG